jgi:uncharacterized protein
VVIGVATWELEVLGAQSLKEKRRVIRSLKDRLHARFNISVAETAHHDLWQRAELTGCVVATEAAHADSVLESADRLVNQEVRARVIRVRRSFA